MDKRKLIAWILMVLYLAALSFLCFHHFTSIPDVTKQTFLGFEADKVIHFCMFFPFPSICYVALFGNKPLGLWSIGAIILVVVAGCALGAATELVQGFTPYRTPDMNDFLADAAGIAVNILGVIAYTIYLNVRHAE